MSLLNDGLLLYLPLNEIQGESTVFDDSGNQWNGKAYNTQVVNDDIFGRCLEFAGNDGSYVELSPLQATVDFSQGLTVEAWVRITGAPRSAILELGDASGTSSIVFHLSLISGLFLETYARGQLQSSFLTTDENQIKGSPLEGEWLHIAVSISPDIDPALLDTPSASMDQPQKQERANAIVQPSQG